MGSQMHWKWDETVRCYRARAALTCHRRGSIESRATNGANLKRGADQLKNTSCTHTNTVNDYNDMTFTKESGVIHVFR